MEQKQMQAEPHRPEKKFRAGAVSATIWKNASKTGETDASYFSVSLERNYKDKEGNWKQSSSLRVNDLPRAALVLAETYKFIVMQSHENKPQEAKQRIAEEIVM